jgi:hypothetical protein
MSVPILAHMFPRWTWSRSGVTASGFGCRAGQGNRSGVLAGQQRSYPHVSEVGLEEGVDWRQANQSEAPHWERRTRSTKRTGLWLRGTLTDVVRAMIPVIPLPRS